MLKERQGFLIDDKGTKSVNDLVATEACYKLYINDLFVTDIILSPSDLKECGVGHLITEGFLTSKDVVGVNIENDIIRVLAKGKIELQTQNLVLRTSSYLGSKYNKVDFIASKLTISRTSIISYAEQIYSLAENWKKTGGLHVALLFDAKGNLIKSSEDIGRHNTIDKVVGYANLKGFDLREAVLAISGRLAKGMVMKAARCGIPILISKAATTDAGIDFAEKAGLTLIGFARGNRFTVYTHRERVLE